MGFLLFWVVFFFFKVWVFVLFHFFLTSIMQDFKQDTEKA